jgi:ribosomal protein L11 methyltransferase
MYLWRRLASQKWWSDNEKELCVVAGDRLAIIEKAGRKQLQIEAASSSRTKVHNLVKQFGGRMEKLPSDWLRRFSRKRKTKPLRIGQRLIVARSPKNQRSTQRLIIPAGTAFGTGEHATTAMSLRLIEKLTRNWKPGWSIVDLGTGSGILALAAKRFGARRAIGIDNDPLAISTAKENARLNKISGVEFRVDDVRRCKLPGEIDIIAANLFSELLIEILPKPKAVQWLILSGILREQERDVTRALERNKIDILQVRRRGKWVAILAAVG